MLDDKIKNAFKDRMLSIIIPAYNEEKRLGPTLRRIFEYMNGMEWRYEVIVVDDGSADGTAEVARKSAGSAPLRVIRNETNMGKGASVRRGMLEAKGEARLFTDADLSMPIENIETFIPFWLDGAGLVLASRKLPGAKALEPQKFTRRFMSGIFNMLVRLLLLPGFRDTQCGFKLFSAECAEAVFQKQRIDRFAFDVETLALARDMDFILKQAPVVWKDIPSSKVGLVDAPIQMFLDIFKIKFNISK
jgi:dolichyl-phosphate beta-glucosyltransferase